MPSDVTERELYHIFNRHPGFEDAMLIHKVNTHTLSLQNRIILPYLPLCPQFQYSAQESVPPVSFVRYTTKADAEFARHQMQEYPQVLAGACVFVVVGFCFC